MEASKVDYLTSGYLRCKLPGRSLVFSALVDSGNLSKFDLISESLAKRLKMRSLLETTEMWWKTRNKTLVITVVKEYLSLCSEIFVMI